MGVGVSYAMLGMKEKAVECVEKLERRQLEEPNSVIDADLVGIWFALGNMDKVFYHIKQCVEKRTAPVNYFLQYPLFKGMADDPRYADLKEKAYAN
jgi:hypothetical protein